MVEDGGECWLLVQVTQSIVRIVWVSNFKKRDGFNKLFFPSFLSGTHISTPGSKKPFMNPPLPHKVPKYT